MTIRSAFATLFILAIAACAAESTDDGADGPSSPPRGADEAEGKADDLPPAPPVDGAPRPDEITEAFGVFVASGAPSPGDGTRARPFPTLAAGLQQARLASKRVYVCEGKFAESVTLERGIPMIGGYDCATWARKDGARTRIDAPSSPALRAVDILIPTRFDGFEVHAPDGTEADPTSIGLLAKGSPGVIIASSTIVAGRGKDGARGADAVQLKLGPVPNGHASRAEAISQGPLSRRNGQPGGTPMCIGPSGPIPELAGDPGGTGGMSSAFRCGGDDVVNIRYAWIDMVPGTVFTPSNRDGRPGAAGADGASATSWGVLSAEGFAPADGARGADGAPGKGGRAGDGGRSPTRACTSANFHQIWWGPTGPGGGAGGCPGLAGDQGRGG
ncbi:MAG: hypothetical protein KF894_23005, partial [Labilithrix sp.]|nr:hypothetical protein [Labilithrix sp.]